MLQRFICVGLALVVMCAAVCWTVAQEKKADEQAEADQAAAPPPFDEVYAQWRENDKQLDQLIEQYRGANAAQRQKLVEKYREIGEKQRALLPALRASALAAYHAAPNEDERVTSVLVGLVANDVRIDQYERALELAQLLLKNNCPEPALPGFAGAAAYCVNDFEAAEGYLKKAHEADALTSMAASYFEEIATARQRWQREQALREQEAQADNLPRVRLQTSKGEIVLELFENEAPQSVGNFVNLVERGFYDGLSFHRVLAGFMAQGGCPQGDGAGGPGYDIFCECYQDNHRHHFRGSLSMAHAGRNTGGSQFFLTFRRTAHLDGRHTVFGRVVKGLDVLAQLQRRDPTQDGQPAPDKIVKAEVLRKREHAYLPTKVE